MHLVKNYIHVISGENTSASPILTLTPQDEPKETEQQGGGNGHLIAWLVELNKQGANTSGTGSSTSDIDTGKLINVNVTNLVEDKPMGM